MLCAGGRLTRELTRYDALNLLDTLPVSSAATGDPGERTVAEDEDGFSDLPSDAEEFFYFKPAERAQIGRDKKKRRLQDLRAERLLELERREEERAAALALANQVGPFSLAPKQDIGICLPRATKGLLA